MSNEDGEAGLANDLAQKIGDKIFDGAFSAITDPILASLGLGGAPDYDAYFDQIQKQLDQINLKLDEISQRMDQISQQMLQLSSDVADVRNAEIAISTQITDVELQGLLDSYHSDVDLIDQNFQSYINTLTAMKDSTQVQNAVGDLFGLFQVNNLDAVATAMRNVHQRFVGGGEMKGLITYQADVFNQVLSDWASNTANTNRPPVCKNSLLINSGGWTASVPDASLIVSNWLSVCGTALSSRVIPIFKSVLAAQLEGLLFLSAGWGNTPLQSNLKVHMENITATVAAMNGWWATFNPDAAVAAAIQAHGQRLAEQSQTWAVEVPDGEYTFDSSWMPWVTHADDGPNCTELCICYTAALVQQPWNFGSCTAALNISKGAYMRELPDGSFRRYQLYFINIGTVNIAPPSQSKPPAPPDVLAQFLAGLPADPP